MNTSASRLPTQAASSDTTCPHPAAFITDVATFETSFTEEYMLMMGCGLLLARKLPVWISVLVVVSLELVPLFVIRDNLALNIWNLLAPNAQVAAWQAGG